MTDLNQRLQHLSPQKLALLARKLKQKNQGGRQVISRRTSPEAPLTFAQQRLWFLNQLEGNTATYNIAAAYRFVGKLDASSLERAFFAVTGRHEVLRANLRERSGLPVQVFRAADFRLRYVDLRGLPNKRTRLVRGVSEEASYPFDLRTDPLFRVTCFRLSATECVLSLVVHHIVFDGLSMGLLLEELQDNYRSILSGQSLRPKELAIQYGDFAAWQRRWLCGEVLEKQLTYWRRQLADAPVLSEFPRDKVRPKAQTYEGGVLSFYIPGGTARTLTRLSHRTGTTPFMLYQTVFGLLLARYSGNLDLLIGTVVANRNRPETEALIGFFVNTLVLRNDYSGNPTFLALLARHKQVALDAFAHQDVPFERLVEEVKPKRSLSFSPLFQVMFAMEQGAAGTVATGSGAAGAEGASLNHGLPGLRLERVEADTRGSKFDLTLNLEPVGDGRVFGALEYNLDLFENQSIARIACHFQTLLSGVAENPGQGVSHFPLLGDEERVQVLRSASGQVFFTPEILPVTQQFEAQGSASPDAIAAVEVVQGYEAGYPLSFAELSYGQLDRRANRLARVLRRHGVGPDRVVAICLDRGLHLAVAVMGVLKAGAAYLPLDPNLPSRRTEAMLRDAGVSMALTTQIVADRRPLPVSRVILLDTHGPLMNRESHLPVDPLGDPVNLAYVIFTSGSTNKPKGVMVTRVSLANAYLAWKRAYGLNASHVHLQMAAFSFDVFSGDFVRGLCSGGRLVFCPREILLDPERLYSLMCEQQVDTAEFVPAVLRALVAYLVKSGLNLKFMRILAAGSDAWYGNEYRQLRALCGDDTRVINSYGLTEATIDSTFFEGSDDGGGDLVPIGKPFGNNQALVVDRFLRLAPIGVVGELAIGGLGLSRGYLNRPGRTAASFVPHPFDSTAGARLYRTGDLARRLADGNLGFLGRVDHQVKIRGFRIELGEIQSVLGRHEQVSESLVVTRPQGDGEVRLVAYVVVEPGGLKRDDLVASLRLYLREHLPEYMVPGAFSVLTRFPLTPHGKIDRRALPEPDRLVTEASAAPPRNPAEATMASIWEELLEVAPVGIYDDFFALGGHSLMATRVCSKIRQAFGRELPLRHLFEAPTVAGLCERLAMAEDPSFSRPPIRVGKRPRVLPLSFAQERLWFLDRLEAGAAAYHMPDAFRLRGGAGFKGPSNRVRAIGGTS